MSAAEAAYVRGAFTRTLSTATGILIMLIGMISAATVSLGAAGYVRQFVDVPVPMVVIVVVLTLMLVAAWGVFEFVVIVSAFTLVVIGGLLIIVVAAIRADVPAAAATTTVPVFDFPTMSGIMFASLLAFFAFMGFQNLVTVVEETRTHRESCRSL